MSFSDEILMAFADGALDETTRRAVEEAMRKDHSIAQRVAQFKARRGEAFATFGPSQGDMAPPRPRARPRQHLHAVASQASVVSLDDVRASRAASAATPAQHGGTRQWSWREWSALGATLLLGLAAGGLASHYLQPEEPVASAVISHGGGLAAHGALAAALSQQLAGKAAASGNEAVRIGVSFISMDGNFCRSFLMGGRSRLAGLACRSGQEWKLPLLMQDARPISTAAAFASATELPGPVLDAIDQRINGQPLDGKAEMDAQRKGWLR